ncbi:MAG: M1 family peptidase, partial [Acidobacteria bacterium]|nr:M1 family peptidase [Acidobacteriota bacterium]
MNEKFMRKMMHSLVLLLLMVAGASAQRELGARPTDSGGPLMPEQAAYDVKSYDLALTVNPGDQSIKGTLTTEARIVHPTEWFVLDLDEPLKVESVYTLHRDGKIEPLEFERRGGKIWIAFPLTKQPGETIKVSVNYGGKPRVAPRPPWVGGFIWSKTATGEPWIATACQKDGADLWWPCKDHPSDEPDSMTLRITVPEPLICATNGRLQNVVKNNDGTRTFNWLISVPFNNYSVALNIAPYRTIEGQFKSMTGETVPITFWVLPQDYEKGQQLFPQIAQQLSFFEKYLGPYPFRAEKIGVAQTPHLGMEHSTITAYGANFKNNPYGFDS